VVPWELRAIRVRQLLGAARSCFAVKEHQRTVASFLRECVLPGTCDAYSVGDSRSCVQQPAASGPGCN